jgi:hypothetical protein
MKAAKRKVQRTDTMTTEQLAKKAAKDVKQMSDVEKAKVREHIDRELKNWRDVFFAWINSRMY